MVSEDAAGGGALRGDEDYERSNYTDSLERFNFKRYRNNKISIKYPSDWYISEEDDGRSRRRIVFTIRGEPAGGGALRGDEDYDRNIRNNNISYRDIKEHFIIDYFRSESRGEAIDYKMNIWEMSSQDVIDSGPTTIKDRQAKFIIASKGNVKRKCVFLKLHSFVYTLEYVAPKRKFNIKLANYMMKSFDITDS
jgi:hypothetical protein